MKVFFIVLLLLLFTSFSFGQEYRLWSETITATSPSTTDSDELNFTDDFRGLGTFHGLFTLTLDLDSTTTKVDGPDSLYFYPMYKINGTWFVGDTIEWDRIKTADYTVDDTFIDTNIELVIAATYHDSLLVWVNDPTVTTDVAALPVWQDFKVRASHGDSINVGISLRAGRY